MALRSVFPAASADFDGGPLFDAQIGTVLASVEAKHRHPAPGAARGKSNDPLDHADYGYSIHPQQGELVYLLCRSLRAKRVAEFATSVGFSTLYLAAAMRDNGGGLVIGAEIVPQKIAAAERHLAAAGLSEFAEIRPGDARETLRDAGGDLDLVLIDGWPVDTGPSLALEVIKLLAPQMQVGAIAVNDNAEGDYLDWIRDPVNGFRTMCLPLKGATELSVKV